MQSVAFGQYYPKNSVIHRMDARIKILLVLVYMVAIFLIDSYVGYVFATLFLLGVTLLSQVPVRVVIKSVKGIMLLLIFTLIINLLFYKSGNVLIHWGFIRITDAGIGYGIKMFFRLTLLVMGASMLTYTTTSTELTDGLESLLKPLKYIKVPVHDIAIIMSIALRFIPTLIEETGKIMNAQKARGASIDTGNFFKRVKAMLPILIPLFVSAFRRADELADALDARCYNASTNRTKMKVLKVEFRDYVGIVVMIAFVTLICLDKYLAGGAFIDNAIYSLFVGA